MTIEFIIAMCILVILAGIGLIDFTVNYVIPFIVDCCKKVLGFFKKV